MVHKMIKLSEVEKYVDLNKKLVIYGVGRAGKIIQWLLNPVVTKEQICFCDNAVEKQNELINPPVFSVEKVTQMDEAVYLVGFCGNVEYKIQSAVDCLHDGGVSDSDIILVDMSSRFIEELYEKYLLGYIDKALSVKKERESINKIDKIKFMSAEFTPQREEKGGGGPVGAVCMQKKFLGDYYGDTELEYPYYIMTEERELSVNARPYITGTIDSVRKMVKEDKNIIYVANDVFSAFALYIMGKNYSLIHHA